MSNKRKDLFKRFKKEFIEKVRQFHLKYGWKPRRARLDAIICFNAELEDTHGNNSAEMIEDYGFGRNMAENLRWNVFSYYFD